ncbi:MAG: rhomboid family intramembrane serine protease [Crocinitomix sp.]|nr:rhomboid family intramembrane serine protease [Crocinitomix sp.]
MYVTYLLLAITILISVKAMEDMTLKGKLMMNPYDVVHNKKWYRCFSHAFIHADFMHLGFNMFVLYGFGIGLEDTLVFRYGFQGYIMFTVLYLLGILFATLPSLIKHKDNPSYNALGASGAVMAVLFAYILTNPERELELLLLPGIDIPGYIFGPIILAIEYAMSKKGGTGIAHDAHFAGAIFGVLFITAVDYHYLLNFFKHFVS